MTTKNTANDFQFLPVFIRHNEFYLIEHIDDRNKTITLKKCRSVRFGKFIGDAVDIHSEELDRAIEKWTEIMKEKEQEEVQ